jgi:signal transduction histidine kinase
MMDSKITPVLQQEREQTDISLTVERDKANESLVKAKVKTEQRTDKLVKEDRKEADDKTSTSRTTADNIRDSRRENINPDIIQVQKKTDDLLVAERIKADTAVEQERLRVDAAISKERQSKDILIEGLLHQEREATDTNLRVERVKADSEVQNAQFKLTTRDEFLAIVSHDLKNPLGAIAMSAEIMMVENKSNDVLKKRIEAIQRNAQTALRLISDILDMERIAQGKLELQWSKESINEIITEALSGFEGTASLKSITLNNQSDKSDKNISCDKDRVIQILNNLIGNALKFTPEGGCINLKAELHNNDVEVQVTDNGPGIPKEKQNEIFNRMTQLASADRQGLGLGLYISKMLVEAHHGKIWVDSQVGKGSTFHFTLPLKQNSS